MNKIITFIIAVYLITMSSVICYASLLAPFISKLAPAAAVATGVSGGHTIPAKIFASTSTGAKVASWISLAVPGTTAAKVAAVVLTVSGGLAADYLMLKGAAWFAANKITKNHDTDDLEKTDKVPVPNGYTAENYTGTGTTWNGSPIIKHGIYGSSTLASAALNDWKAESCPNCGTTNVTSVVENGTKAWYATDNGTYHYFYFASAASHYEDRKVPIPVLTVKNKLDSDLAAENSNAKEVAKAALEVSANAMDNQTSHPVATNTNAYNTINNYLIQNITTNQVTNLEAAATTAVGDGIITDVAPTKDDALTAAQIAAAVQAALAGQGLSASQIAAAIAAAQSASSGGLTPAELEGALQTVLTEQGLSATAIQAAVKAANEAVFPPLGAYTGAFSAVAWAKPTVGNFSALFSNFLADMRNTPLFSLPGLLADSVPSGGSCEMSINLSSRFGGTKTISICNWETGLSALKAALLCFASIFAVSIVVKGGS